MTAPNIASLIDGAAARLRTAGVPKPRREAHRLWAWLNRVSTGEAWLAREGTVSERERVEAFEDVVARRMAGEPLAYLLGHTGFRRLEIRCDRRALIPRPETEGVVDHALQRASQGRALDLGTGTGCLALALADEGDFAEIVAVDLSREALNLAALNAAATGLRIDLLRADLGEPVAAGRFQLIVSNPPYLSEAEYAALDDSVRRWEPRLALASGGDGLDATRRVIVQARRMLVPQGWLVMELDSTRADAVAELARAADLREVAVWNDLFGRPRYLTARRSNES